MLIEIHMLKNYPPVNLNRDETGSPKTCVFGGFQRGRISSQCLKRTWRTHPLFVEKLGPLSMRTRHMPDKYLAAALAQRGVEAPYIDAAVKRATGFGNKEAKMNAKGDFTEQIISYSPEDLDALADVIAKSIQSAGSLAAFEKISAKDWQAILKKAQARPITLDIALFGRMVTDDSFANVDAAMQVAHAISVHTVNLESDFYTAVDDLLQKDEEVGAGMMGDIDFNACCYYHYVNLDIDQLRDNLRHSPQAQVALPELLSTLLTTMAHANPSGKQNSFAGHVLPDTLYIEIKKDPIPVGLFNAFAKPVDPRFGMGLRDMAAQRLAEEIDGLHNAFGLSACQRLWFHRGQASAPACATPVSTFPEMLASIDKAVSEVYT